eukprot:gene253-333_t
MPNKHNTPTNSTENRGFASMSHEKVQEIASKGGHASAAKAGHQGMVERGRAGGQASAAKAGHEGMAARGRAGGQASHGPRSTEGSEKRGFAAMPTEKVQEIASKGGHSSHKGK